MRLGQIARKLETPAKNILTAINNEFNVEIDLESNLNFKLDETHIEFVLQQFEVPKVEEPAETIEEAVEEVVETEQIEDVTEPSISEETTSSQEVETSNTEEKISEEVTDSSNTEETKLEEELEVEPQPVIVESAVDKKSDSIVDSDKKEEAPVEVKVEKEEPKVGDKIELPTTQEKPETPEKKVVVLKRGEVLTTSTDVDSEYFELDESVDIIRAPKVELEGIKVLGKINLPEPKPKKEEIEEEPEVLVETVVEETKVAEETITEDDENKPKETLDDLLNQDIEIQTTEPEPVVLDSATRRKLEYEERKRKREEWAERKKIRQEKEKKRKEKEAKKAAEKKIKDAEDAEKDRRRQAYLEKLNKDSKSVSKKQGPKKKSSNKNINTDTRPEPTSLFGKLWRWLNT